MQLQHSSISHNHQDRPSMTAWAIAYARRGYRVFPLHEPLFDHPQGWRCSCEEYRHTDACRQRDAERAGRGLPPLYLEHDQHCDQPGKHPRVAWRKKATIDEPTIRTWWRRWPSANIGLAGDPLLILDADTYKDAYAGDDLLDAIEETVTSRTGGGGRHLWFTMPAGKTWGNGKGNLPAGIDIRGAGGYIVAPPSLHTSGNRYHFADGRGLADLTPVPVPAALAAVLDVAYERAQRIEAVQFTAPVGAAPDLAQWDLSDRVLDLIRDGADRGRRSESDMTVCVALCFAGASDDQIRAVFAHNAIGAKYRERGDEYLGRTIAGARQWAAEQENPVTVRLLVEHLREWVRRADFEQFVPLTLQAVNGYRTRHTDVTVADAILDIAHERGRLVSLAISPRELARRAGLGSANTATNAMTRLRGWFIVEHPGAHRQQWEAVRYDLATPLVAAAEDALQVAYIARCSTSGSTNRSITEPRAMYATSPLATHKAHDAFTASMTPITEEELQARIDARNERIEAGENVRPIERSRYRRRLAAILPSAGRGVLRLLDALATEGAGTKAELRVLLNVSPAGLSRLVARAVDLGLVEADRHTVTLLADWAATVEVITPHMPTAGRGDERADREDAEAIRWAERMLNQPDITPEEETRHRRRKARSARRRRERAERLRPDLTTRHADVAAPRMRPDSPIGLHTPNRAGFADRMATAAYWNRLGKLTPAQRAYVEMANMEVAA